MYLGNKKKSASHKTMMNKIKLVSDEYLEQETITLQNLFKKRRLQDKYVLKIRKIEERIRILKTLNNPKHMNHELTKAHLSVMLNRSGVRQDVVNKYLMEPNFIP